jgi:hypothetical protein
MKNTSRRRTALQRALVCGRCFLLIVLREKSFNDYQRTLIALKFGFIYFNDDYKRYYRFFHPIRD